MGQTMVEKIVSRQMGRKVSAGEKIARLPITKLFFNDVIGPPAIEGFRANFSEVFARYGRRQITVDEAADFIGVKPKQVDELESRFLRGRAA